MALSPVKGAGSRPLKGPASFLFPPPPVLTLTCAGSGPPPEIFAGGSRRPDRTVIGIPRVAGK